MGAQYRGSDLVFCWEDGRALHPDLVTKTFRRLARKAGLRPIPVHGLRHSFATLRGSQGWSWTNCSSSSGTPLSL